MAKAHEPAIDLTQDEARAFEAFLNKLALEIEPESALASALTKLGRTPSILAVRMEAAARLPVEPPKRPRDLAPDELDRAISEVLVLNMVRRFGVETVERWTREALVQSSGEPESEFASTSDYALEGWPEPAFKRATGESTADEERDGGGTGALNWDPDDARRRREVSQGMRAVLAEDEQASGQRTSRQPTVDAPLGADELLMIEGLVDGLREAEAEDEPSKDGILLGLASALGGKGSVNRDLVFARRAYEMGKRAGAMQLSAKAAAFAFGSAPPFIVAAAEEERRTKVEELIAFYETMTPEERERVDAVRAKATEERMFAKTIRALMEAPLPPETLRRILADIHAANAEVEIGAGPKREERDPAKNPLVSFYETMTPDEHAIVEHAIEEDRQTGGLPRARDRSGAGFARRAQILKELRERRGLGVRQLAELAGTSHTAILRYESGERDWTVETLIAIAGALETSTDVLLGFEDVSGHRAKVEARVNAILDRWEAEAVGLAPPLVDGQRELVQRLFVTFEDAQYRIEELEALLARVHATNSLTPLKKLSGYAGLVTEVAEVAAKFNAESDLAPEQVAEIRRRADAVRRGEVTTVPIEDVFKRANEGLRAIQEQREVAKTLDEAADEIGLLTKALIEIALASTHDEAVTLAREAIESFEGR